MVNGLPAQPNIRHFTRPPTQPQPAAPSLTRCCNEHYNCLRNVVANGLGVASLGLIGIGTIFNARESVNDEPENPGLGIALLTVGALALLPRIAIAMKDMYTCCTTPRTDNFPDINEQPATAQELADYNA